MHAPRCMRRVPAASPAGACHCSLQMPCSCECFAFNTGIIYPASTAGMIAGLMLAGSVVNRGHHAKLGF